MALPLTPGVTPLCCSAGRAPQLLYDFPWSHREAGISGVCLMGLGRTKAAPHGISWAPSPLQGTYTARQCDPTPAWGLASSAGDGPAPRNCFPALTGRSESQFQETFGSCVEKVEGNYG